MSGPAGPPQQAATEEAQPLEQAANPRWWTFPRTRRYLARFSMAGLTGALLFYCLSLTPSLLPRAWYLQAVMSGITVAIGYAAGTFVGWLLKSLIPWHPGRTIRLVARWSLAAAAIVLIPLFGYFGAEWQHDIRELVDAKQPSEANYILVVVVSLLIALAIVSVMRGIIALVRLVARPLSQGRTFVDTGPTEAEISKFSGTAAMEPIRVYAGLKSAPSIADESELAVRELDRTGAFHRKVIVIATTTGTGWLNPAMIDPLEYMYDGDTAVAGIQYSYLPSWISFLVDKAPAQEAGRDLFDAVYGRWLQLPAGQRPQLVVFGESLGSFGGEAAFTGPQDIRNRVSGVLWVGPTNSNTLWSRFTSGRDPGSPEWRPVFQDGRTVRFATLPSQLDQPSSGWQQPRVVYLQNTSDPIVWWSWNLAFHQPDWLHGTHPPDVSSAMHWYPLVTFWQVAADLALSTAVPPGHGHTYGMAQAAGAWASIVPPPGWTAQDTEELGALPAN